MQLLRDNLTLWTSDQPEQGKTPSPGNTVKIMAIEDSILVCSRGRNEII